MIEMNNGQVRLHQGDSRNVLKTLADCSIDSIVCDPPYALVSISKRFGKPGAAPAKHGTDGLYARASAGFMGKDWDVGETAFAETFWAECLRVLKPGGHVIAFGGTRTYHRLVCAIEDAGFEIRDQIGWVYGSGFPKSHNQHGEWEGWGTALKPAWEPICLARKPLAGTVAANLAEWGVGALNIDGCRVPTEEKWVPSTHGASDSIGTFKTKVRVVEQHEFGRWPANIIHDGSDEVLAAFPDAKGQQGDLNGQSKGRKSKGIFGDMPAARQALARIETDTSAARFFYCAKASRKDRDEGLAHLEKVAPMHGKGNTEGGLSVSNSKLPRANIHPTVKPTDLMRYLCRLITPPGGTILDPFMGSGSTGKASVLEGFNFIGIEREDEYMPIAEARIAWAVLRAQGGVVDVEPAAVAGQLQPANDNTPPDLFSGAA